MSFLKKQTDLGYATDNPPPASRRQRISAYRNLWLVALGTLVLDQLTKIATTLLLPFPTYPGTSETITLIPGFLHLAHVGNKGAAWSLFDGKTYFLAAIALITLGVLYACRKQLNAKQPLTQIIGGLLIGGILGNLLDRIFRGERLFDGHVVDFIDVHFGSYIYPTFNVADIAICAAAALYVFQTFLTSQKK